jgi:putative endopeptidase
VKVLADDGMQGRETGSPGLRKAEAYVVTQLEKAGLRPGGTDGSYYQTVKLRSRQIVEKDSSAALIRDGRTEALVLGDDAIFSTRGDLAAELEAPLVFVGYGLKIPEKGYDDLAGLDLQGKVAVVFNGSPAGIPGPLASHYQTAAERWKAFRQAGLVGIIMIPDPASMDIPWSRMSMNRTHPSMELADPAFDETKGEKLAMVYNPAKAEALFSGSGHAFADLAALGKDRKPLPRFPLTVSVKAKAAVETKEIESENVVAALPGSDPVLQREYVVLSAHIDHIGIGETVGGDSIYNGAMDNASGSAVLLDVASSLGTSGDRPKRSLLFVFVTGEEKGLLGSRYFAQLPTVTPGSMVADVNVDMFLPIVPLDVLTVWGLAESDLGDAARAAAWTYGVRVQDDPEPQRNIFIRSDQYNFIRHGIPAVMMAVAPDPSSREQKKTFKDWLIHRYHAPSDDLAQPVDLSAAGRYEEIVRVLTTRVADDTRRPQWKPDSFFRRYAASDAGHGVDLAGMDRSVAPGDDFFAFANGVWVRTTEIPPDRASTGNFTALVETAQGRTRGLLEEAERTAASADPDTRRVGDFYAAFMDEAGIEAKGLEPLRPHLEAVAAMQSRADLSRALGAQLRADVDPLNATNFSTDHLLGLWVGPGFSDPGRYTPYLLQGGLGMPDRDYYLSDDPHMAELRARYREHVVAVLRLAGIPGPEAKADAIVALEGKIARAHASLVESQDVLKANNPWRRDEFGERAPGLDWPAFFEAAGLSEQASFIVWHARAVTGLSALVASEPLEAWKAWLSFHIIDRHAGVLPRAFVDEAFAFHGRALTGTPQLRDRWKRGVSATDAALGEAVGRLYVRRYFPPEAKAKAQDMVKGIVAAFQRRIDRLAWMSLATRAQAKRKLGTLYVGLGYPESWRDDSGLRIARGDAFGNRWRSELYDYQSELKKLGRPVDQHAWCMTPQTVNAVNLPLQNALNFPAAILQPPFFDPDAEPAVNYGAIGAVIGHEISHSFDDQGSQFDAEGRLANWWTPEDLAHFKAAAARLAAQYDAYKPFPDLAVNGQQTLSENIADVAGLAAAYDGWKAAYGAASAGAQGLTAEQLFFVSYAQAWRTKERERALRAQVATDGHAPAIYRVFTVRNLDPWYAAFDIRPGQALYLVPEDRVQVW